MMWHDQDPSVPCFVDLYPNWHKDPSRYYAKYSMRALLGDDSDSDSVPGPPEAAEYEFEFFDDGLPILPPISLFRTKPPKEKVMRRFLNAHWGECSRTLTRADRADRADRSIQNRPVGASATRWPGATSRQTTPRPSMRTLSLRALS